MYIIFFFLHCLEHALKNFTHQGTCAVVMWCDNNSDLIWFEYIFTVIGLLFLSQHNWYVSGIMKLLWFAHYRMDRQLGITHYTIFNPWQLSCTTRYREWRKHTTLPSEISLDPGLALQCHFQSKYITIHRVQVQIFSLLNISWVVEMYHYFMKQKIQYFNQYSTVCHLAMSCFVIKKCWCIKQLSFSQKLEK